MPTHRQHVPRRPASRPWTHLLVGAVAVLLVGLVLLYATIFAARLAGLGVVVVRGSVDRSIAAGSVVFGHLVAPREVRPGQSILFEERSHRGKSVPQLRRVVELSERDGRVIARTQLVRREARTATSYVLSDAVISPVFSFRYAGYVLALALTPIGWLVGFALPASLLCFVALRRIWTLETELPGVAFPRA